MKVRTWFPRQSLKRLQCLQLFVRSRTTTSRINQITYIPGHLLQIEVLSEFVHNFNSVI